MNFIPQVIASNPLSRGIQRYIDDSLGLDEAFLYVYFPRNNTTYCYVLDNSWVSGVGNQILRILSHPSNLLLPNGNLELRKGVQLIKNLSIKSVKQLSGSNCSAQSADSPKQSTAQLSLLNEQPAQDGLTSLNR